METLKKGDFVRLVIGSKMMIVNSFYGKRLVECIALHANGKRKIFYFRPESLVLCSSPEEVVAY